MKANELMIGDLVQVPCLIDNVEHYDAWCKVKQLRDCDLDVIGFKELKYNEIMPIPLTAEILEKNFNGADPYGIYFFGDEYIEVYIREYTDGLWRVEVDEVEMGGLPTWKMYVSNIHELQHALRLAGVEKEIEP